MTPLALLGASVLFTFLGIACGIVTGLIPGLHVNTISALIIILQGSLIAFASSMFGTMQPTNVELLYILCCMIMAMSITHTFLDFIPSVFLGAPDEDTALSILPGHRLLLEGRGYEAIKYSAFGSFASMLISLTLIIPAFLLMGPPIHLYEKMTPFIPYVLLLIAAVMITGEIASAEDIEKPRHFLIRARHWNIRQVSKYYTGNSVESMDLSSYLDKEVEVVGTAVARDGPLLVLEDEDGGIVRVSITNIQAHPVKIGKRHAVTGTVHTYITSIDNLSQVAFSLFVFMLAGFLGILVLWVPIMEGAGSPIPSLNMEGMVLFPVFTGLFGLSSLLLSLITQPSVPDQEIEGIEIDIPCLSKIRGSVAGTIAGAFVGWFPGISSGVATVMAKNAIGGGNDDNAQKEFIISVSGVNTSNALFGLVALFVIMKARSGAMVGIQGMLGIRLVEWGALDSMPVPFTLLLVSSVITAGAAVMLTLFFGKMFARGYTKIPYSKLTWSIIILLIALIFVFTGPLGLMIAAVCTLVGMLPPLLGIKRVHLMGVLMLPIMLFFFDYQEVLLKLLRLSGGG
jgi:TctA family transporter